MKNRLARILTVITLLASMFALTGVVPAQAATNSDSTLSRWLNPDGSLNLSRVHAGSFDVTNYSVSIDPARGPIFRPQMAPGIWNSLGTTPLNGPVSEIVINGSDMYVGGQFTDAGGDPNADYIAKWNGSVWSALGTTPLNAEVYAISISGTDVYVGGSFTDAGNNPNADYIAKWDGSAWSAFGAMPLNNLVLSIAITGTNVYVGGSFTDVGGDTNADYIAKWDGANWSALGTIPLDNNVQVITINGTSVYVGGTFLSAGGNPDAAYIAKWDGSQWSSLANTQYYGDIVYTIAFSGTDVYVGGLFWGLAGTGNDFIAKWNGISWGKVGESGALNNTVLDIGFIGKDMYVSGFFKDAGGNPNADYIAKWDGTSWSALGTTPLTSSSKWTRVDKMAISGQNIYAGGDFLNASGNPNADYIARFEVPLVTATPTVTRTPTKTATRTPTRVPVTVTINQAAGQADPATISPIHYTAVFSEAVSGFSGADIRYIGSTLTGTLAAIVTEIAPHNGTTYDVAITGMIPKGTVFAKIAAGSVNSLSRPSVTNSLSTSSDNSITFDYMLAEFASSAAKDGWLLESTETSNAGGSLDAAATTLAVGDDASNREYRSVLDFPTSSLPDNAVIYAVTLRVIQSSVTGMNPFTTHGLLRSEIKSTFFGGAGALQAVDFAAAADAAACTFEPVPELIESLGTAYRCIVNAAAFPFVHRASSTQLRLRFTLDDNNNLSADTFNFYSGNFSAPSQRPRLFIKYYIPPAQ